MKKTEEVVAKEHGVSPKTIRNYERYAKAVDTITENLGNEIKEKILSGELKTTQNATGRDNFTNRHEHLNHVVKTSP